MALAPFFGRIHDSVGALAHVSSDELASLLLDVVVDVRIGADCASPSGRSGADLLIGLLARLYPRLRLSCPQDLHDSLVELARTTNPALELVDDVAGARNVVVVLGGAAAGGEDEAVRVTATGWLVVVDGGSAGGGQDAAELRPAATLTWQAAACVAAAETFRAAFAIVLGEHGRRTRQPGQLNILNASSSDSECVTDLAGYVVPELHLAGAGAVGQAALLALRDSGVSTTVVVVDPEQVELSNLQRYVLSDLADVGRPKVDVAVERLAESAVTAVPVATRWGQDARSAPGRPVVLAALDSARDRLGVAAGLHTRIYNAWTQPDDLGWSRHEQFGVEPCLACLYLPRGQRPSEDEQIAQAVGQHRLRVLAYFVTDVPVGQPLPVVPVVGDVAPPPDTDAWLVTSLLDDLVVAGRLEPEAAAQWAHVRIGKLYRDGICGAGLIEARPGLVERDVVVPLAHQSALAGVMLATSVVAAHLPELRAHRSRVVEMRLDLRVGLPQWPARPRQRTPGCICSDADYVSTSVALGRDGASAARSGTQ